VTMAVVDVRIVPMTVSHALVNMDVGVGLAFPRAGDVVVLVVLVVVPIPRRRRGTRSAAGGRARPRGARASDGRSREDVLLRRTT